MLRRERRGTPADLLVVGLGNPGEEYAGSRHNSGADTVGVLAGRHGGRLKRGKERALAGEVQVGGGLAGNNGLRSIKQHLHTDAFCRVRIGVGKPPGRQQGADHVLRRPGKAERTELDIAIQEAADAVEILATDGPAAAMNKVN